jgi:hypothetical protein
MDVSQTYQPHRKLYLPHGKFLLTPWQILHVRRMASMLHHVAKIEPCRKNMQYGVADWLSCIQMVNIAWKELTTLQICWVVSQKITWSVSKRRGSPLIYFCLCLRIIFDAPLFASHSLILLYSACGTVFISFHIPGSSIQYIKIVFFSWLIIAGRYIIHPIFTENFEFWMLSPCFGSFNLWVEWNITYSQSVV